MKIILFGALGQVGQEITQFYQSRQVTLIGLSRADCDISSSDAIDTLFKRHSDADVVINAAAFTAVDSAEDDADLAYLVNAAAVKAIAINCQVQNIPLIHLSTDYVFNGEKPSAYLETDFPHPTSVYGASKLAGEQFALSHLTKTIVLRVSWVFGKTGNNFVKTILRLATQRKVLSVVDDQFGCPTAAKDIARVVATIAAQVVKPGFDDWGIYHYCGEDVVSWYTFAESFLAQAKNNGYPLAFKQLKPIATKDYPTKATRPQNSVLNVEKIKKVFNICQHSWDAYLAEVIDAELALKEECFDRI